MSSDGLTTAHLDYLPDDHRFGNFTRHTTITYSVPIEVH